MNEAEVERQPVVLETDESTELVAQSDEAVSSSGETAHEIGTAAVILAEHTRHASEMRRYFRRDPNNSPW